jgi:hypothetical protein
MGHVASCHTTQDSSGCERRHFLSCQVFARTSPQSSAQHRHRITLNCSAIETFVVVNHSDSGPMWGARVRRSTGDDGASKATARHLQPTPPLCPAAASYRRTLAPSAHARLFESAAATHGDSLIPSRSARTFPMVRGCSRTLRGGTARLSSSPSRPPLVSLSS